MKIEEVEALEQDVSDDLLQNRCIPESVFYDAYVKCVEALRAEAWHPIEKAAELGAKDGREVEVWMNVGEGYVHPVCFRNNMWEQRDGTFFNDDLLTHFRFINPPKN